MYIILGAGLSGISAADHLNKINVPYAIYENKEHGGGHIHSRIVDGFTWDEGPHVSFTKYGYVKDYFAKNCNDEFLEYPTKPTNYFKHNWIPHPAQSNMYAVPEPLRSECIHDVLAIRSLKNNNFVPYNYAQWSEYAFGKKFAETFSDMYTIKYWTTHPENLTTDWIGKRIYFPEVTDMVSSAEAPLEKKTHYIDKVRYPKSGGYYSYIKEIERTLDIKFNKEVSFISFNDKTITFSDGETIAYSKLISTLPLPNLIKNSDAPAEIKKAANELKCSKVLIVNVVVNHLAPIDNHWIYVYDEELYSTRINFTELLSPNNGVEGKTGIQVEVYFSDYREREKSIEDIANTVIDELVLMRLIKDRSFVDSFHTQWLDWANVIFDNKRSDAQNKVFTWLENHGLVREEDDLLPMTDWESKSSLVLGDLILAGRFAQWKYYWTDDCVMRGKYISENIV